MDEGRGVSKKNKKRLARLGNRGYMMGEGKSVLYGWMARFLLFCALGFGGLDVAGTCTAEGLVMSVRRSVC